MVAKAFINLNTIIMFGLFKSKKKKEYQNEPLSLDSKEGRDSLYANLYFQVNEDPTNRCCLHIFRDGKEHYHVANGLNSDEIAKELFIAMNRSNIIRDAVIGAYKLCFASEKEKDDIKGYSYTLHSLIGIFEGMACHVSEDNSYVYQGGRTYHVDCTYTFEEFCEKFSQIDEYDSIFIAARIDERNVMCLVEGNPSDIIDSLKIASVNNLAIGHIINESSK